MHIQIQDSHTHRRTFPKVRCIFLKEKLIPIKSNLKVFCLISIHKFLMLLVDLEPPSVLFVLEEVIKHERTKSEILIQYISEMKAIGES